MGVIFTVPARANQEVSEMRRAIKVPGLIYGAAAHKLELTESCASSRGGLRAAPRSPRVEQDARSSALSQAVTLRLDEMTSQHKLDAWRGVKQEASVWL